MSPYQDDRALTKENFLDEIAIKYPVAFKKFSEWIDEYKIEVEWDDLFNRPNGVPHLGVKYHDLPYGLQLGIWIEFASDFSVCGYEVDFIDYDMKEDVNSLFQVLQEEIEPGDGKIESV